MDCKIPLTPLIFDRSDQALYAALGGELVARGGHCSTQEAATGGWSGALRRLPPAVMPQILIGAPLAAAVPFEALASADLSAFAARTLLETWLTLQELCGLEYPEGASIVVLQSVAALDARADCALARAALFALRAMLKAAALESRRRTPALRFNLLLIPPAGAPLGAVLDALEQIASSSFLTGSELVLRAQPAAGSIVADPADPAVSRRRGGEISP